VIRFKKTLRLEDGMGSRMAALWAFLGLVFCCALLTGCHKAPRPQLVLAQRPETPSASPAPSAAPDPAASAEKQVSNKDDRQAWFVLAPVEGNTAFSGSFATSLPEGTAVQATLRIAPLGGPVTLTEELTVRGSFLDYDFSGRLPRSAIDRQFATLTLCLNFGDPQPQALFDAFGETGERLVPGFVTGKVMAARVEMRFALPFPDWEKVADLDMPCYKNQSDLVFATSSRFHALDCRYAASAEPCARAYAEFCGLSPCALCCP